MSKIVAIILVSSWALNSCGSKKKSEYSDYTSRNDAAELAEKDLNSEDALVARTVFEIDGQREFKTSPEKSSSHKFLVRNVGASPARSLKAEVGSPWRVQAEECPELLFPGESCPITLALKVEPTARGSTITTEWSLFYGPDSERISESFLLWVEVTGSTNDEDSGGDQSAIFGRGTDGDMTLNDGETRVVNRCYHVDRTLQSGELVATTTQKIDLGKRVLLWQVQAEFAVSGNAESLTKNQAGNVGSWQLLTLSQVRISGSETLLSFREPLKIGPKGTDASGQVTQVCTVTEYRNLTIAKGANLVAENWNGATGGIVALMVSETLDLEGEINATGAGFRGGSLREDNRIENVDDLDTDVAGAGGGKGEGLDSRSWLLSGRGNYANAGGGGNAHNAGGGGGASGGAGGLGGTQERRSGVRPTTQGLGGAALHQNFTSRLSFGGGGGAGQQNQSQAGAGGAGGGIILIFAKEISGSGEILANGLDGQIGDDDGAGGGGGGGQIILESAKQSFTGTISAIGGDGGNVIRSTGPGGGGGGGRILIKGDNPLGNMDAASGKAGTSDEAGGDRRGATDGAPGIVSKDSSSN